MSDHAVIKALERQKDMESIRGTWESHWQEVVDHCMPNRADINIKRTGGEKRGQRLYDSTAIRALSVLAAGLHGQMTSPSSPWFALRTKDPDRMKDEGVAEWMKYAERVLYDTFNESNFGSQIHELYGDMGSLGTAVMYEEEDPADIVRFHTRTVGECYLAEDHAGRVDTVHRKMSMTARQAWQRWGDSAGEKTSKAMKANKPTEKVDFLHAVFPREDYNPRLRDAKNKPWASMYIEINAERLVQEAGYEEFPFYCPRWLKRAGDVYGYSPAMDVLADIKMLNAMSKTIIRAAQKIVDPPLQVPSDGFLLPVRTMPGGLNFRRSTNPQDKIEPLATGANIPVGLEMEDRRREAINQAFMVDLFLLLAQRPQMTATEVVERVEEKMVVLGPTIGRLMSELLDPMITRTFNILLRNGKLGMPPDVLAGEDIDIEYISPLARAQRLAEAAATTKTLESVLALAQAKPDVMDNVDFDRAVRILADVYGPPPDILRAERDVAKIRQQRAQQEAAMQQMEAMQQGADVANKLGVNLQEGMKGAA